MAPSYHSKVSCTQDKGVTIFSCLVDERHVLPWKYNISDAKSDFFIVIMRRAVISFSELGVVKSFMKNF